MNKRKIVRILYSREDGTQLYKKVSTQLFQQKDVQIQDLSSMLPTIHDWSVAVFIITKGSVADTELLQDVKQCFSRGIPIVPLVDRKNIFDFTSLPDPLSLFNVLAWYPEDPGTGEGEKFLDCIKKRLGLGLFNRDRKFFISYRRSDGMEIAREIQTYFSKKGYRVFMDITDIEGGDIVQRIIHHEIRERDFLLLINSPEVPDSQWIFEEIQTAIENRVKIFVLHLDSSPPLSLPPGVVEEHWREGILPELETLIQECITSTINFDSRVDMTLQQIADLYDFSLERRNPRQLILFRPGEEGEYSIIIEYEDAPHSLERLYRLYENHRRIRPPAQKALFIHNELPLSSIQQAAVCWAVKNEPLEVLALEEILGAIKDDKKEREK
jgi:hypothetical protein